jgi:hypothetical protein
MISIDAILAIVTAATSGTIYIYDRYSRRSYIKRIVKTNDPDIEQLLDIYEKIIDQNIKIDQQYIVGNLYTNVKYNYKSYLFIAKFEKKVIGFTDLTIDFNKKYIFVSYFGVDKANKVAREKASIQMASFVLKFFQKKYKNIRGIIFEVESPFNINANSIRLNGRIRTFKNLFQKIGLKSHEIDYDFIQPEIPKEEISILEEQKIRLIYVPLNDSPIVGNVDKEIIINILEMIYLGLYERIIQDGEADEGFSQNYPQYISKIYQKYVDELPQRIKIK